MRGHWDLCANVPLLTWPLDLIGVSQVLRGRDEHLSVGDGGPKWNHVESAVVPDRSVLLGVHHFTCRNRTNGLICIFF